MKFLFRNLFAISIAGALLASEISASGDELLPLELNCSYTVKDGENLTRILFEKGIGTKESIFRLYGNDGWVKKNKYKNPKIMDWSRIEAGTEITLVLPTSLVEECTKEVVAKLPDKLPIQPMPDDSQLSADNLATQPEPPEETSQENAGQEFDDEESFSLPNLGDLASASVDLRYSKSLESAGDTLLLSKLAQYSVVFESRYAALQKIRVYFDYMPRVSEHFLDKKFYVESARLFLGRAFLWDLGPIATLEITPKIGYWRYESSLPLIGSDGVRAVDLGFANQLSFGGDIGLARRFGSFTPRLWHGREFTASLIKSSDSAAGRNYRTGFEAKLDGPDLSFFSALFQMYVVGFVMEEANRITKGKTNPLSGAKDNLGQSTSSDGDDSKDVDYQVNYAGFGLGLSW